MTDPLVADLINRTMVVSEAMDRPEPPRDLAGVVAEVRNALVPARHHLGVARGQFADDAGVDLGDQRLDRLDIASRAINRILGMATAIAEQLDKDGAP